MSALDQAFIKAYAKDGPAPPAEAAYAATSESAAGRTGGTTSVAVPSRTARPTLAVQADVIEQIYHDGTLYRVDTPRASVPRHATVPTPHFQLPPRTSPRRNVRRSMLKLLGQPSDLATPMPVEPPLRQESPPARRVQRSANPRPTQTLADIAGQLAPPPAPLPAPRAPQVELSPEVIFDAPLVDEPLPTQATPAIEPKLLTPVAAPAVAPPPSVAPLNLAQQFQPHFEVHGHWDAELAATPGSLVVCPAPSDLQISEPAPLIELKLVPLPIAPVAAIEVPALPTPTFRVDPPHAAAAKPHAKFSPSAAEPPVIAEPIRQPQGYFGDSTEEQHDDAAIAQPQQSTPKELDFADRESATETAEPSARTDSTPELAAPDHWNELASPESSPQTANTNCVPVWEVDRFQWPVTVERLVSDKGGYFAQASGRLLAAVRDGLRTLAISGSRRGEGRTTLALALARSAAKAGIQVAVIDADFARPQLAARIGLEVNHGWQDAATGLVPLSETAVRSLADNVTVLPLEASAARAGLSLADARVTATLRAAAATFELVIVDLGPLAVGDEPLFPDEEACPLDAAIVVRDLRYASAAESEDIGQRLMAAGVEAVGIAENFVVEEELPVTSV